MHLRKLYIIIIAVTRYVVVSGDGLFSVNDDSVLYKETHDQ